MNTALTPAERLTIRAWSLRRLAAKAKRTPAQVAAAKANIQKAQAVRAKNRLRMWY